MSNKLSLMVNFIGIDKMSSSIRSITQLGRKGSRSLGELRGEGKKLESQLRNVRREIDGASGNVSDLVNRERDLERAIDRTNRELDERKRLNAIDGDQRGREARGQKWMANGRENIVQGATMAAPLILAVKAAGEFSSGMVDIQQKANLSDAATAQLASRVVTMAKGAKRMPEDIRAGLDLLLAKGGDTLGLEAAEKIMGPAGRIATAYKVDVPDAASAAYAAISNLKVPAAQSAKIFDIMASAGNAGAFEVKNMARHFPALTAQMQALGEKGAPAVADLSAALQVAMKTAGSEDEAGNNIKNLLAKINAPATIRAFEKNFGVNLPAAMKKLTDAGYSSMEAIAMVTKQATGGDMGKLGFAFEDQQARMGIMALLQNLPEYRKIRADALAASGTVDSAFDQRVAKDAMANWEAFKGGISSFAIVLGEKLLPPATQAITMIGNMASRVGDWAQANPRTAATIMKVVAGLAVLKIGLGAAQLVLGAMLGPLGRAIVLYRKFMIVGSLARLFPNLAVGMRLAGIALRFMLGPIGLVIAGLVLLGLAVWNNWDKIKVAFMAGKAWLANFGSNMLAVGQAIVMGLARGIAGAGSAVWNALKGVVLSGVGKVKNLLGIKSPSRVFMAIGAHTGEGMAVGLDRQRRRVTGAAGRLATGAIAAGSLAMAPTAMAAPRTGGAGGQAAGATNIEIHIHQRDGENTRELARRVAEELRRAEAGAGRRSYEDGI